LEAKIILEYDNLTTASAIATAVSPDNLLVPSNLSICTSTRDNQVLTEIKISEKISTLIATIDDFLFCVSTAEKTLSVVDNK
jgi:tRNA threonylcarbamoyladenosine modification (KEOPS) complex  Pcc1 subunit